MNKTTKWLLILLLLFIGVSVYLYFRNSYNSSAARNWEHNLEVSKDSVHFWTNAYNQQVASTSVFVGPQAREWINVDSIVKAHQIKGGSKNLSEQTTVASREEVSLDPDEDSMTDGSEYIPAPVECPRWMSKDFSKGSWYKLSVRVGDGAYARLTVHDTMSITGKWVNEGNIFNRRKVPVIDVSHSNPYVSTEDIKAYRFTDPKLSKKNWLTSGWGIGASVGYMWNGKGWGVSGGVAISKTIIRLSRD